MHSLWRRNVWAYVMVGTRTFNLPIGTTTAAADFTKCRGGTTRSSAALYSVSLESAMALLPCGCVYSRARSIRHFVEIFLGTQSSHWYAVHCLAEAALKHFSDETLTLLYALFRLALCTRLLGCWVLVRLSCSSAPARINAGTIFSARD